MMKKYKIALGICGPHVLYSNVIRARDERDAVVRYLTGEGEAVTDESVEKLLKRTFEHIPKPRKKDE